MATFKKHVPNYVDTRGVVFETVEFSNMEELEAIEFVKLFSDHDDFFKFSINDGHLLAEFDEGYKWWVVGYLFDAKDIGLPEWDHGRTKVTDGETEFTVEGKDVSSYCGDVVTMANGRTFKKVERNK